MLDMEYQMSEWIIISTKCFNVQASEINNYGGFAYDSGWIGPENGPQTRIITESKCHDVQPNPSSSSSSSSSS